MAVSIKLGLQQTQKLALTQSLMQSIELLQLSTLELSELLSKELVENPVLEEEQESSQPGDGSDLYSGVSRMLSGDDSLSNRIDDRESEYADTGEGAYGGEVDDTDRKRKYLENIEAKQETLTEHLLSQARITASDEKEYALLERIITSLEPTGLLYAGSEELARDSGLDPDEIRRAVETVGNFDPVGCGAATIRESLLIQARHAHPDDALLRRILADHYNDLERLDYDKIARGLGVPLSDIVEKSRLIQGLTPFPGRQYTGNDVRYVIPDIEVRYINGEIVLNINDDWLPRIHINRYYLDLVRKKDLDKNLREFIRNRLQSARSLMKSVAMRKETMVRVVSAIMVRQQEFLARGHGHLRPLTHTEIAEELGVHESTVSRATSNKFVQTPWGVYELKYFFVSKVKSEDGGDLSSERVLSLIREIVAAEDPASPYSDEEILERLKGMGVSLARRTVAKYRGVLNILSSDKRKKLNMIKNERQK